MTHDLRDKDIAVLQAVRDGASNVAEIREATTLTIREINYSLIEYSLEDMGLVDVDRVDGREWREQGGRQIKAWKPKQVHLTDKGIQTLADLDIDQSRYEDMDKQELIEQVQELEERLDRLENVFKNFRDDVMKRI